MSRASAAQLRTMPGPIAATGGAAAAELAADDASSVHALPEGARLSDYEIVGPIGEGGFGIVYLAWDHALQQHVAIKEYLPVAVAARAHVSNAVVVKSQRHADTFRTGLGSFVNEARLLAHFDHPALVKVLRFWEDNGTAYMAMPFYEGPTLTRALAELGRAPDEAELRGWLRPLLDALSVMHAENCFHRDIAPDNILITDAGPVLLDLGAARRVLGKLSQAPTVLLKPGFAPIEQYGDVPSMQQGPWTDLYALASVVYAAITGKPPMPSIERLMDDQLQPLAAQVPGRYSPAFLAAIDAALALRPNQRPQSVAEFWALLNGWVNPDPQAGGVTTSWMAPLAFSAGPRAPVRTAPQHSGRRTPAYALAAGLCALGVALVGYRYVGADQRALSANAAPSQSAAPAAAASAAAPAVRPVQASAAPASTPAAPPAVPAVPAIARTGNVPRALEPFAAPDAPEPAPVVVVTARTPAPEPAPTAVASRPRRPARAAPAEAEAQQPAQQPAVLPVEVADSPLAAVARGDGCNMLQRPSLESLTIGDAVFVKKECQP